MSILLPAFLFSFSEKKNKKTKTAGRNESFCFSDTISPVTTVLISFLRVAFRTLTLLVRDTIHQNSKLGHFLNTGSLNGPNKKDFDLYRDPNPYFSEGIGLTASIMV